MFRKLIVVSLLVLAIGGIAYAQLQIIPLKPNDFIVNQPALAVATNSDTITGPVFEVWNGRRASFLIKTNAGTCSLGFVFVGMTDTLSQMINADGLPGLLVTSDMDNAAAGTSGRVMDLIATGPNRIRYRYARPVLLPKCCASAVLDSIRFTCKLQLD